jgi:hypothetical protein
MGYKRAQSEEAMGCGIVIESEESSFEMPACQDMSLGAEDLN